MCANIILQALAKKTIWSVFMKKKNKVNWYVVCLFCLCFVFTNYTVNAFADSDIDINIDYEAERSAAMQAGFTEEQFEQIMHIPNFSDSVNYEHTSPYAALTPNQTKVINKAMEQIGKPYSWGANGPDSFDCGGLVQFVYKQAVGIELPMGTINQEVYGKEVSLNSLLPGDLLFYGNRGNTYHVGIYKGDGIMIHAPQPGQNVTTVNIQYFYPSFARRILSSEPDYPFIEYNKMVTVTHAWSIWSDLQFSREIKKATIGENYKIGKLYTNTSNNAKYAEILVNNKTYGFINYDAVIDLTSTQINRYLTAKSSGQNIWGNLEQTNQINQTTKDKIYFIKGAYILGDGKYLYSLYKHQNSSEWIGYLKADISLAYTPVEEINQSITVTKSWSVWNNLQWEQELEKPKIGAVFSARLKLTNVANSATYYKIYRNGSFYGFINTDATRNLTTTSHNKYVTFTTNNEDFWTSLYTNYSKGKTERGRIFYIGVSYDTPDNQPIYSIYTDESLTEWRGYYKGNNFEATVITTPNNKRVNVTKAGYNIWGDLNFWTKTSLSVIGNHYNVNRKFFNSVNSASYYELIKDNKIYGYINSEAVQEVSVTSHNKYVTFISSGEDFWTSLDTNYSKGKTERGRIFYIGVSYDTPNNQSIYSIYTDESLTEWKGYYKGNSFEATEITPLNNTNVKITKAGYTIWGDLNFLTKSSVSEIGDQFTVNRKFYNSINNSSYYELLINGYIFGYINAEAAAVLI